MSWIRPVIAPELLDIASKRPSMGSDKSVLEMLGVTRPC